MDFQKVEEFIRLHWPAALMVAIIVAPSVWGFASLHYSERITVLELEQKQLSAKVSTLEELAERSKEKPVASTSGFTAEELFTPSPPLVKGIKK
jgi:hypothetical protein